MSANDPRDSAGASGPSPFEGFPSESSSPAVQPKGNDPGAIDELVRNVRSRAAATGTPRERTRLRPLHLFVVAAAALTVVVVIRAWPTIDEATGTLGSRVISALTPTRLVERSANDAAAGADPATAEAPRRAARPASGAEAPRQPQSAPSIPSADPTIAAQPKVDVTRATGSGAAAPLAEGKDGVAPDTVVYSTADPEVQPPKLLSQGPGQPAKVMSERTRVLEVLVRSDGSVEQVNLKSTEARLLDPILLSHAKMWQFDPAQRAGRPVAYRLVLMWDSPK